MQEEVENRTVNLAISTTKLTGRTIIAGIRKYLQHREKVKMKKARDPAVHGWKGNIEIPAKCGITAANLLCI